MLGSSVGVNVEDYTTCTRSEYHVVTRPVLVDVGKGNRIIVAFSFVVNATNVVVAKKNNAYDAYKWIVGHTNV